MKTKEQIYEIRDCKYKIYITTLFVGILLAMVFPFEDYQFWGGVCFTVTMWAVARLTIMAWLVDERSPFYYKWLNIDDDDERIREYNKVNGIKEEKEGD